MVSRSKSTINDGNTQYSELMSDYSEINATIYDGLYVSGDKVIDVIKDCAEKLDQGVQVMTIMKSQTEAGAGGKADEYKTSDAYVEQKFKKSDAEYINPSGTFVGSVNKNGNGMVISILFKQIN